MKYFEALNFDPTQKLGQKIIFKMASIQNSHPLPDETVHTRTMPSLPCHFPLLFRRQPKSVDQCMDFIINCQIIADAVNRLMLWQPGKKTPPNNRDQLLNALIPNTDRIKGHLDFTKILSYTISLPVRNPIKKSKNQVKCD